MITFQCLKCGEQMEAPSSLQGELLDCPKCLAAVIVPEPMPDTTQEQGPDNSAIPPQKTLPPSPEIKPQVKDVIQFKCSCGAIVKAQRKDAGKTGVCPKCSHTITINEPTQIKRAQKTPQQINRAVKMLRECNQAAAEAQKISLLMQEICRIVVQVGGYRLAWVGLAEHDEKQTVRAVAQMGYEEDYIRKLNITWANTERGRGPTGTAIRTKLPVINRNVLENPHYHPWRSEALKRGYASSIALPLFVGDRVLGALNIYAAKPDAFGREEVTLLIKLADNLAEGTTALLTRHKIKQAKDIL